MNIFVTKLVFQIHNGAESIQFDEQLRLFVASDSKEAYKKAVTKAMEEETYYMNEKNEWVHWEFKGITEITKLETIEDGMQIDGHTVEMEIFEERNYLNFIKTKALGLKRKHKFPIKYIAETIQGLNARIFSLEKIFLNHN
jgi:hypothetical protein